MNYQLMIGKYKLICTALNNIELFERTLLQCEWYIIKIVTKIMKWLESIITNTMSIRKEKKTT